MGERLTWQEIKRRYPHQYVGLVDVEYDTDGVSTKTAVVAYTSENTSYDELVLMYINGDIRLRYTALEEEMLEGVIWWKKYEPLKDCNNYTQVSFSEFTQDDVDPDKDDVDPDNNDFER